MAHHGCAHDHSEQSKSGAELGAEYNLHLKIDKDRLECLNEAVDNSGRTVFKSWENRLAKDEFVESDADEELLFNIPFTGHIKLKGIIIIGANDDSHPACMRLYKNRPKMTFDDVGVEADQEIDLQPDPEGILEYKTKPVKFNAMEHLTIHISKNFGDDVTRVYYIGLRGDFAEHKRHGVTIVTYEARANPADHKSNLPDSVNHQIQ